MKEMLGCLSTDKKFKAKFMLHMGLYFVLAVVAMVIGLVLLDSYNGFAVFLGFVIIICGVLIPAFKMCKLFFNKFACRYVEMEQLSNKELIKKFIALYIIVYLIVMLMYIAFFIYIILALVLPSFISILLFIVGGAALTIFLYTIELMLLVVIVENQIKSKPGFKAVFETFFSNFKLLWGFSIRKAIALIAITLFSMFVCGVIFTLPLIITLFTAPVLFVILIVVLYLAVIIVGYWAGLSCLQFIFTRIPRIIK